MQSLFIPSLIVLGGAITLSASIANAADTEGSKLKTTLAGGAEVPGPGDADGSGTFSAAVNPGQGKFCYELTAVNIAEATMAHVHIAPAGQAGPVSIPLATPSSGKSSGCADIDRDLAMALIKTPANYYVNVHNADFPAGAIRGQLTK